MKKIEEKQIVEYFQELITPYEKNSKKRCFISQFLNGDGKELADKFWHLNSSSRLAYDMYKWMKDDDDILDVQFEYHLPGPASGGKGPNMDVYVETQDSIYFIESKFTEKPKAWILFPEDDYTKSYYLSRAYYYNGEHGKMNLSKRFRDYPFATDFSKFCYKLNEEATKQEFDKKKEWFDIKQETCHLFGVLSFIYDERNRELIKNKKIYLMNIVCQKSDCSNKLADLFSRMANSMIEKYAQDHCQSIEFEYHFIQDVLKTNKPFSFPINVRHEICNRIALVNGEK